MSKGVFWGLTKNITLTHNIINTSLTCILLNTEVLWQTTNPLPKMIIVGLYPYCYVVVVWTIFILLQQISKVTDLWLVIGHIFLQANPIKENHQVIKYCWFHLNMSTFSTRTLIWANQKTLSQLSQPIFLSFSCRNSPWHNSVFELCRGI